MKYQVYSKRSATKTRRHEDTKDYNIILLMPVSVILWLNCYSLNYRTKCCNWQAIFTANQGKRIWFRCSV